MAGWGSWLIEHRATRVVLIAGLFPLGLLSLVSVAVVVFDAESRGWQTTLADCAVALAILTGVVLLAGGNPVPVALSAGGSWLIAGVVGMLTGMYGSLTLPIQALVLIALLSLTLFYLLVPDSAAYWAEFLREFSRQMGELGFQVTDPELLQPLASVMTGMVAGSATLTSVVALFLGTWWGSRAGGPSFRPMFLQIRMGFVIGGVAVLAGLGAMLGAQPFSGNVLLVLAVGLAVQGLAVIHWHAVERSWPRAVFLAVYLPLFLGPSVALITLFLLTALGFMDNWYGLRRTGKSMV
jgi:hypothetical protein